MLDLQEIRKKLDEIDKQMVSLFEERMKLCQDVARFKIQTGKAVYDRERELQKLAAVRELVDGDLMKQGVEELFSQIMTTSKRLQYGMLTQYGKREETGFTAVKSLPVKGSKVVYQGVEGAYSHQATLKYFGRDVDCFHVPAWEDAMKAVEQGEADFAVVPIENSSAGAVSDNYDLMMKFPNYIVAEVFLPVDHALLGMKGSRLEEIETVYSHPQALMQCSEYLNRHKQWKQVSVENTAVAAKKVLEDQDPTQAAVASSVAGELYQLEVLQPSINYSKSNTTRFLVLAKMPVYRENASRISICFELPHKSGSLYHILSNFIYNQVNMVMIESRPVPGKNWEYRFFVDIEGNLSDDGVQSALKGIQEEATNMRILGNY